METTAKQPADIIQDTKKHIIDIARHLFSECSYLGVSMSEIAKKLNITKAALYYHFTGKAEIYGKVLDDVFDDLSSTIGESLKENTAEKKLQKLIKNYLDFGSKENNLVKALMLKLSSDSPTTKHIVQLREQVANLIQPVIEEMAKKKKLAEKIDSRLLTSLLTSMMDGLLLEYSFLNKKINSAKIADQIITVLF
ncbi:MAG: TetR/AcrR family transcriptional regulator [Candidatus Moranbacteria bacterium]|nr:TetR/AcrR family transcriptional regulator [Candidatus Moranbacteria bacterium]